MDTPPQTVPEVPTPPPPTLNALLTPAALLLAGLFIGGAIIWNGQHPTAGGAAAAAGGAEALQVDIKAVKTAGEPYIGNENAPVTIAFWADYQCPFCKRFEQESLPSIIKEYVDTGKAKVVFFDYAFLGNDSVAGAEYGRAIWKLYPDKYFVWRTAMYNAQDAEGDQGFGNAASIDKLDATILGVGAAQVKADVAANKAAYDAQIDADKAQGSKFGIQATPSFIIGTKLIAGAYPFDTFKTAIDPLLK